MLGVVVGTGAWAAYGAWRVLHARPEPVPRRRSKGLSATTVVVMFALINVANANPARGFGLPAAFFALGLVQSVVVILARRRLGREPALLVNNTITANALYRTQFPEPGMDESASLLS